MNNAYITLLSTNNYIYACIGLMYSWKETHSKYPFYCIVTEDITESNINILKSIGYEVIVDKSYIPDSYYEALKKYENSDEIPTGNSTSDLTKNGWQFAWSKLLIFKYTQFDKLLFIDADSYIIKNLDDVFDRPAWSSIGEYDSIWRGTHRFCCNFMLIHPDIDVYNELLQLAEDNPLIVHPSTNMPQLSNDYDLLNMYKSDWGDNSELCLSLYTYLDSYCLRTSDYFIPYIFNSFAKLKAVHLTGPKPWLCGTEEVANYGNEWGLWKELYLIYIKFLNKAIEDISYKGIAHLDLIQ